VLAHKSHDYEEIAMSIDKEQAKKDFDDFLIIMDDQLDALSDEADKHQIKLDFSLDDFERLEHLFGLMSDGIDKEEKKGLIVMFARHLGEIVRLRFGGQWHLPLDDEKNVNFNTPVIMGHSPVDGLEYAPISAMRGYSLRRRAGSLRRGVDAGININPLDLSDLIEE
jgi:hypothetical protein